MITLFERKKDCCGCAACMNICPKGAITMKTDQDGFVFPEINKDLCIECGLCNKVCAFQNVSVPNNEPLATYVAINKKKTYYWIVHQGDYLLLWLFLYLR